MYMSILFVHKNSATSAFLSAKQNHNCQTVRYVFDIRTYN